MSSRRTTLGPLNMAQMNARAVPARVSNAADFNKEFMMKPPRMSIGPSTNSQAATNVAPNPLSQTINTGRRSSLVPPPR